MNDAYAIFGNDTQWLDECGFIPGEGCLLIGSEDCDWNCPYRDHYYQQLHSNSTATF